MGSNHIKESRNAVETVELAVKEGYFKRGSMTYNKWLIWAYVDCFDFADQIQVNQQYQIAHFEQATAYIQQALLSNAMKKAEQVKGGQTVSPSLAKKEPGKTIKGNMIKLDLQFFAKKNGTPGNNIAQNKQVNDIVNKVGLSKKQQRILHDAISHQNYSYQEILDEAKYIKDMYPNK